MRQCFGMTPEHGAEERPLAPSEPLFDLGGRHAPWHHDDSDDSSVVDRQAHYKVTLVRHFAGFTPASGLTRPGNDVALNMLELRLRLFHGELLIPTRLLKHLPARCDPANRATGRHGFDIRIEQQFRCL